MKGYFKVNWRSTNGLSQEELNLDNIQLRGVAFKGTN